MRGRFARYKRALSLLGLFIVTGVLTDWTSRSVDGVEIWE